MNIKPTIPLFLGVLLLAACSPNQNVQQYQATSNSIQMNTSKNPLSLSKINLSDADAEQIALNQVNGTITKFSRDFNESIPYYEISIVKDNYNYEFEISAVDGTILEQSMEPIVIPNPTQEISITHEQAKEIALGQVNGTITEFDYDLDDIPPKYEVSIVSEDKKYKFDISAVDGSILSSSMESIYN